MNPERPSAAQPSRVRAEFGPGRKLVNTNPCLFPDDDDDDGNDEPVEMEIGAAMSTQVVKQAAEGLGVRKHSLMITEEEEFDYTIVKSSQLKILLHGRCLKPGCRSPILAEETSSSRQVRGNRGGLCTCAAGERIIPLRNCG